ncbi:C40 family peptidase [Cellulophaga sp. Hel_I_12]|uniref:C40 family peptidase n=1 Tax=Cellulophaga sp. Hel_I_12 TaxID=1249972 RepID=UPI000646FE3B|nr:C40 family peptidase [Cellulophaga sp. Hel_I_12]
MHRKFLYILSTFLISSCGVAKKKTTYGTTNTKKITVGGSPSSTNTTAPAEVVIANTEGPRYVLNRAEDIIDSALEFSGTRYKLGGTTSKGMDCSGLLFVAFSNHDIHLPRTSYSMAEEGKEIRLKEVTKGDLVFFKTSRKAKKINHVGLVVAIDDGEIKFIHSTTSRGVIVSSLKEGYWNSAFIKATRIL